MNPSAFVCSVGACMYTAAANLVDKNDYATSNFTGLLSAKPFTGLAN